MLAERHLRVGVSKVFQNISDFRAFYTQAMIACSLGTQMQHPDTVFLYEHYSIFHALEMLGVHSDLRSYCCDKILLLETYDETHQSDLVKSLQAYLDCERSFSKMAQVLHMHRNTAAYRIDKCKSIMNTDFTDAAELFSIQLSLKILEHTRYRS